MTPITLAAVGTVVLAEGVKFLYNQAGEILRRWRERREAPAGGTDSRPRQAASASVELPPIFEGQLSSLGIHFDAVERLEDELRQLRKQLTDYVDGVETVEVTNQQLLETTDALRRLLEAVYQQRITFKGEQRPSSGPLVEGEVDVGEVAGYAAAVRARVIERGEVRGRASAKRVGPGGQLTGVDVDKIGDELS